MQRLDDRWLISASDLVWQMQCDHHTRLRMAELAGLLTVESPEPDAALELVKERGLIHERAVLAQLRREHGDDAVVAVPQPERSVAAYQEAAERTAALLRDGTPVVYQAVLFDGTFVGFADFLVRDDALTEGAPGGPRYLPVDTKLARHAKPGALLQLAAYADQLARLGLPTHPHVQVWLGTGEREDFPVDDLLPVVHRFRRQLVSRVFEPVTALPDPTWGDARAACGLCGFHDYCADGREQARDLSLVANIRVDQRRRLREAGIATVEDLAAASDDQRPPGIGLAAFARLRRQARLQCEQDEAADHAVTAEVVSDKGLALLPPPSAGDVWFDMEGDPFADDGAGLEYLFGAVTDDDGRPFTTFWAHSRSQEKLAFERFIDWVVERRRTWPELHIYHYAPYERTALQRLSTSHGTREAEVDDLLRHGVLVDLYAVVRGSIMVSQRSYSIKKLEPLYMDSERAGAVTSGGDSIVQYEQALAARSSGDVAEWQRIKAEIGAYNETDCRSTRELDRWLRARADAAGVVPSPAVEAEARADEGTSVAEQQAAVAALVAMLMDGIPVDRSDRTAEQQAQAMLAAAVNYHAREDKPVWWEHFARIKGPLDVLEDRDEVLMVDAVDSTEWFMPPRARKPRRELELRSTRSPEARFDREAYLLYDRPFPPTVDQATPEPFCTIPVTVLESEPGRVKVRELSKQEHPQLPVAVLPAEVVPARDLRQALFDIATHVVDRLPTQSDDVRTDLLLRRPPRLTTGGPLVDHGDDVDNVLHAVRSLRSSYLAVQGPPGTGKTYVAARVITTLVRDGWRVGVVSQGHTVVENVLGAAVEAGLDPQRIGKRDRDKGNGFAWSRPDAAAWRDNLDPGGFLVGGTAWTFTSKAFREAEPLDLLVVDEAGQFSLANTLAVSVAARNLLLLGDQQQLPQVSQGSHPEPIDESALGWLLDGAEVVPDHLGFFLAESRRMHPDVAAVVSRLSYRGRLRSHAVASMRHLDGVPPGVQPVESAHAGNVTRCPEEAAVVVDLAERVLGRSWRDEEGQLRTTSQADVLVVAPYNAQALQIRAALDVAGLPGVAVGTVDKFQGQQAPVVIVSMTTSAAQDVPRGIEFLLSRNRLNVAISRAQWATFVVHSPRLAELTPTSPEQLTRLGAFLGVVSHT